jgi:hypothetical protein
MKNSLVKRALSLLLAVCSAILALGATYALRRRCEAFGCPNSGILWTAWTIIYVATGAIGVRLRAGLVPGTPSRTLASGSLAVLAVLGVLLASYGLFRDAA